MASQPIGPGVKKYEYQPDTKDGLRSRWWLADDDDMYKHVTGVVDGIYLHQSWHRILNLRHARLYSNTQLIGLLSRYYAPTAASLFNGDRINYPLIRNCIDYVSSKIAQQSPRPFIQTIDGDDRMQRKGKLLQQFIDGVFQHAQAYRIGPRAFTDSCVFGTGFMKVYVENNEICMERVLCSQIVVDDVEGAYEKPRQLHQQVWMDKEVLCDMFPEYEDKIMKAIDTHRPGTMATSAANQLLVTESWHLPSGPDAKDGKHCWTIANCTLLVEDWTKPYFPFAMIRWSPAVIGFFGDGLAFQLTGLHREIQRVMHQIQRNQRNVAGPRITAQKGSGVNVADLSNDIQVVWYNGVEPKWQTVAAMPQEAYQYLNSLIQNAYQVSGISQMNAGGGKPDEELSGIALQTLQDVQTERFALTSLAYENFFMDAAKIVVDLAADLYSGKYNNGNPYDLELSVPDDRNKFISRIKWSDVNLDRDKYEMQIFPTNLLPTTPAGRLQSVLNMHQAGLLNNDEAKLLLEFPDTEAVTSLNNAAYEDARRIVDNIIEEGIYEAPTDYMNLQLTLQISHSSYLRAKDQGVSLDRLELLSRFVEEVADKLTALNQANQPPAPPPTKPIAQPQTPPTSNLVPFATTAPPQQ